MLSPLTYAASIARIQSVGSLLGVPVDRLLQTVGSQEDGRGRRLRLWVGDDFATVAVFGAAPGGERRADLFAAAGGDPVAAAALPALADRPGQLFVEVESHGPGQQIAVEAHALGRAALEDDLALLRHVAPVGDAAHAALAARAAELALGGRSAGVGARFEAPATRQWSLHVALAESVTLAAGALVEAAGALSITAAQRNLVAAIHPVLAGSRGSGPAVATLRLGPGIVYPELIVTYHGLAFEPVIRILIGIHPGVDHASRLGAVAGACHAERVAALSVHLRDREPVGLRVGFDLDQAAAGRGRGQGA
jgi:hypothetical protein